MKKWFYIRFVVGKHSRNSTVCGLGGDPSVAVAGGQFRAMDDGFNFDRTAMGWDVYVNRPSVVHRSETLRVTRILKEIKKKP
jgi:hypothetical protein